MDWRIILIFLCAYGFFKEFRPLEPFLTPYLTSTFKNFTDVELYTKVYPIWTYSSLACLAPIFLLSDLLRYNAILILGALAYGATWILLIFGTTIDQMRWMQFFYGFATSSEIAFFAYGYAAFQHDQYKKTTSYVQSSLEAGRCFAYALGQLVISTKSLSYYQLNFISLGGTAIILISALCLPWIHWKKSFERIGEANQREAAAAPAKDEDFEIDENENSKAAPEDDRKKSIVSIDSKKGVENVKTYFDFVRFYFVNLRSTFKRTYSTKFMWKWSLWCALSTCGWLQVTNYIQNLWVTVQISDADVWNGIVEAINTLLAAIILFFLQYLHVNWIVWGEATLAVSAIIDCVALLIMSQSTSLVLIYVLYVLFRVIYEIMFTIAMYNIAKSLPTDNFGLVFGFNAFIALLLQTILTIAVADERGFALSIRNQFIVYGSYYGLIFLVFLVMGIRTLIRYFSGTRSPAKDDKA